MKKAMIVVSFGTSVASARPCIEAAENTLKDAAERDFFRAFTSPTIRRILAKRGEVIDSLEEALDRVLSLGYEDVIVQPTHLLYGVEYDKIRETACRYAGRFSCLKLGKPLLADEKDLCELAAYVTEAYLPEQGALALMGHGTDHFANMTYPAFQTALRLQGVKNAFVATVEGWPGFEELLSQLKESGERQLRLVPLMLVAGDHAKNDMAGEGGWKETLEKEGFEVSCCMEGLGALPGVLKMYRGRLLALLEEEHGF